MLNTSSNQCLYPNKYRAFGGLILQLTSLWSCGGGLRFVCQAVTKQRGLQCRDRSDSSVPLVELVLTSQKVQLPHPRITKRRAVSSSSILEVLRIPLLRYTRYLGSVSLSTSREVSPVPV